MNKYQLPNNINLCTKVKLEKGKRYTVYYEVYADEDSELIPMPLNGNVDGNISISSLIVKEDKIEKPTIFVCMECASLTTNGSEFGFLCDHCKE